MQSKTKVLHISSSFFSGGIESYLLNFLHHADFNEFEHCFFVRADDGPLKERYHRLPIRIVQLKCTPRRYPYCLPYGYLFCKKNGIDIIHGHNYWFYEYAYFLSLLTGIPLVTSNYGLGLWKRKRHRTLEAAIFKRARINIAISKTILEQGKALVAGAAGSQEKFKLVYPIIDDAPMKNLSRYDRGSIRRKIGITNDRPVFTIIGRIDRLKGHRIALDAAERLNRNDAKINLLIVGAMADTSVLRQDDLQKSYVKYLNYYEPIEEMWAVSDYFLIPSLSEGTPLVLVEYLALGKPIIASDISGNGELIRDGWNGFLFKTGDIGDLTRKIEEALASSALSAVQTNARAFYLQHLSPEKLAQEIEQCYRGIS